MSIERSHAVAAARVPSVTMVWAPAVPCGLLALMTGGGASGASDRREYIVLGILSLVVLAWELRGLARYPVPPPPLALIVGSAELLFGVMTVAGALAVALGRTSPPLLAPGLATVVAGLLRPWKRAVSLSLLPAALRPVQLLLDQKRFEDALAVLDRLERMPPGDTGTEDPAGACTSLHVLALVGLGRLHQAGDLLRERARRRPDAVGLELVNFALDHQRAELYADADAALAALEGELRAAGVRDLPFEGAREELRRRMNGEPPRANPFKPEVPPQRPFVSLRGPVPIALLVLAVLMAAGAITLLVMSSRVDPWKAP